MKNVGKRKTGGGKGKEREEENVRIKKKKGIEKKEGDK